MDDPLSLHKCRNVGWRSIESLVAMVEVEWLRRRQRT